MAKRKTAEYKLLNKPVPKAKAQKSEYVDAFQRKGSTTSTILKKASLKSKYGKMGSPVPSSKSASKTAVEKAARKIIGQEMKPGTSYGTLRSRYSSLVGQMSSERSRTATRAKGITSREAAKQKLQKNNKAKALRNKLRYK